MIRLVVVFLLAFGPATAGQVTGDPTPVNGFCLRNQTADTLFIVVDSDSPERLAMDIPSGDSLCSDETETPQSGFVGVFHSAESIEGCSRLSGPGQIETLLSYADFDRCAWETTTR